MRVKYFADTAKFGQRTNIDDQINNWLDAYPFVHIIDIKTDGFDDGCNALVMFECHGSANFCGGKIQTSEEQYKLALK